MAQSFGGIGVGPDISFSDFDYSPDIEERLDYFENAEDFLKFMEDDKVPTDPVLGDIKSRYGAIINETREGEPGASENVSVFIFNTNPPVEEFDPGRRPNFQEEFKSILDQVNAEIGKHNETIEKTPFFNDNKILLENTFGVSSNPLKINLANKIDHNSSEFSGLVELKHVKSDEDDRVKVNVLTLVGSSYISELSDDLPVARDLEHHGAYLAFTRSPNRCLNITGITGIELLTFDLFSERQRTEFPIGFEVARNFGVVCRSADDDPPTIISGRYLRYFSNPSENNNRHEIKAELYHRVALSDKWKLEIEPYTTFATYTAGANGNFETFEYAMKLSVSYAIKETLDLKLSAEFGQRNSDNEFFDAEFYKIPLGLSFESEF